MKLGRAAAAVILGLMVFASCAIYSSWKKQRDVKELLKRVRIECLGYAQVHDDGIMPDTWDDLVKAGMINQSLADQWAARVELQSGLYQADNRTALLAWSRSGRNWIAITAGGAFVELSDDQLAARRRKLDKHSESFIQPAN